MFIDHLPFPSFLSPIQLVASAPNFPHGMIDPVVELAALAMEFNLGLHVDACLGGFVLPWLRLMNPASVPEFDFRVSAVTSMSVDTHKVAFETF